MFGMKKEDESKDDSPQPAHEESKGEI